MVLRNKGTHNFAGSLRSTRYVNIVWIPASLYIAAVSTWAQGLRSPRLPCLEWATWRGLFDYYITNMRYRGRGSSYMYTFVRSHFLFSSTSRYPPGFYKYLHQHTAHVRMISIFHTWHGTYCAHQCSYTAGVGDAYICSMKANVRKGKSVHSSMSARWCGCGRKSNKTYIPQYMSWDNYLRINKCRPAIRWKL